MTAFYNILPILLLFLIAQSGTWLQMNAQFKWTWLQNHHWVLALFSFPIGYAFIKATKMSYDLFGKAWSGRLIGFSVGIIVFGILTEVVLKEKLSTNTIISLILAIIIMLLQLKK